MKARTEMNCSVCNSLIHAGDELSFLYGEEPARERACCENCEQDFEGFTGTDGDDLDF